MKKLILVSVILHVILIAVLAPVIKTRMEFDESKEAKRTEEVKKREALRKENDRRVREKQTLSKKVAKSLKDEAEARKKKEISQQVAKLENKRDEMAERREEELDRLHEREKTDVLLREKARLQNIVSNVREHIANAGAGATRTHTILGRYPDDNSAALNGFLDDLKVSKRVWTDAEISGDTVSSVSPDYLWNFENERKESISGREFYLQQGAQIVPREDQTGSMLDLKATSALADLGSVNYGQKFTIAVSLNLESAGDGEQIILTNNHTANPNRSIRLLVRGKDGEGKVVFRTTGENSSSAQSSTTPGSFQFGKWTRVIMTADIPEGKVRIFIDGVEMSLEEEGIATGVNTSATNLRDLNKTADENLTKVSDMDLVPQSISEMTENLDNVLDKISEGIDQDASNYAVREELQIAADYVNEAKDALENLGEKTDMEKMNDTSSSDAERENFENRDATETPLANPASYGSAAEMYKKAEGLEKDIAAAKSDIDAAAEAVSQNLSFADAKSRMSSVTPSRPDLASALASAPPDTVGALNDFRSALNRAENEMRDMNARADAALGRSSQSSLSASSFASSAARSSAAAMTGKYGQVVNMTNFGNESGDGNSSQMREGSSGDGSAMSNSTGTKTLTLDEGKIINAALPGRRFTEASLRKGWLYLDTWYVIGPWENNSIVDYSVKHPPEFGIDFDAKYHDGKFSKIPNHPYETLKWEFYQSDQVRCQPPAVFNSSTYYAYTDVWFEKDREMLIAVASDDASSVWLNGQIVWQDSGKSPWRLGEGYRKVNFRKGFNDVLVRIENGPTHCVWSVVLCPPEILEK